MLSICNTCKISKPISDFTLRKGRKNHDIKCKSCVNTRKNELYPNRKTEISEKLKIERKNNPEKFREYTLRKKYGINLTEFNILLNKQNNKCDICKIDQKDLDKKLSVDHCHKTGQIRGLLCSFCNQGIGFLKDDIKILENAIHYLDKGKND